MKFIKIRKIYNARRQLHGGVNEFTCTTRQLLMPLYMQLGDTTDKCMKRVSALMFSVPTSPIGSQNSISTSTKFYRIDVHQRSWCPFHDRLLRYHLIHREVAKHTIGGWDDFQSNEPPRGRRQCRAMTTPSVR